MVSPIMLLRILKGLSWWLMYIEFLNTFRKLKPFFFLKLYVKVSKLKLSCMYPSIVFHFVP